MTPGTLTPAQALAYLRELGPSVTAAAALGPDGARLAGDPALAAERPPAPPPGTELVQATAGGCTIRAIVSSGVAAALARADAAAAAAAVRERC